MKRVITFAVLGLLLGHVATAANEDLAKKFISLPDSAKPSGWWFWFYNLMDKEGITRDLTEFKAKGMGSAQIICAGNDYGCGPMPSGPAYLSPEWRELYRHALSEADRLGLKIGITLCSAGWDMGGPWITKENSCRWFLQSQLTVMGPQHFSGPLPLPGNRDGYAGPNHGNVPDYINKPLDQMDYRDSAIIAFPEPDELTLATNDERRVSLSAKSNRKDSSIGGRPTEIMGETLVPWANKAQDRTLRTDQVVDLTKHITSDGNLEWDVPPGRWTILRTGHRLTGATIRMPTKGFEGLEVDRYSAAAVDQQFENLGKILIEEAGPFVGKTLTYFTEDSFEAGYPNWTPKMLEQFKKYRGYDPTPYLPVFSGRLVGSAEISDRFLHDYRKTAADCMADGHYGRFTELANKHGLKTEAEAAGPSWSATICSDALKNLGRCDVPMGEFWADGTVTEQDQNYVGKQTASAAHIYGRTQVAAEAFTRFGHWQESPAMLKPIADRAFCEGINRFVFHTTTGTRPQDGKPGYEYGAGSHFNPNVTWWEQAAGSWLSYVNRCQALLQSGLFVADVLYYNGDGAPNMVDVKHVDPALGKGYDYDVCNAEVLLTRLSVKKGRFVLPDGMSYRVLVLPDSKRMPVDVLQKIRELVKAGATVVGPKPETDPGLKNYPQCDVEMKKIAAEVWGENSNIEHTTVERRVGKGRVFWGKPLREILMADGVSPDFQHSGDAFIDFIHRSTADTEFYFLANRKGGAETVEATFRVSDRQPELWDPVTGTMREFPQFTATNGCTTVSLTFESYGSMFVVFRKKGAEVGVQGSGKKFLKFKPVQEISGPWTVQFDPKWFYPTNGLDGDQAKGLIAFEKLEDWSKRPEPAVQHFSGTAVYRKVFDLPQLTIDDLRLPNAGVSSEQSTINNQQSKMYLSLGTVKETARVKLNGKDLGVVWCAPWRVEITGAVKPGGNALEIEVVNLWPNRLIGDAGLPPQERRTRTNIPFEKETPLNSSGLIGPVRVVMAE